MCRLGKPSSIGGVGLLGKTAPSSNLMVPEMSERELLLSNILFFNRRREISFGLIVFFLSVSR